MIDFDSFYFILILWFLFFFLWKFMCHTNPFLDPCNPEFRQSTYRYSALARPKNSLGKRQSNCIKVSQQRHTAWARKFGKPRSNLR